MVGMALTIERERSRMLGALGMRVLVARGRISLLLVRGRGRRLMLHTSIRTRARIGHLVSQGKGYVTSTDSLGM